MRGGSGLRRQQRESRLRQDMRARGGEQRQHLNRFRDSFREHARGLQQFGQAVGAQTRRRLHRLQRMPRWLRLLKKTYHEYGGKHVMLLMILVAYQFLGAGIFYACEVGAETRKKEHWLEDVARNRTRFIADALVPRLFNNNDYLFFLDSRQTRAVYSTLNASLTAYETNLGIRYSDQKIKWDFWNAMLYAQTICTTIGYGHLYPSTDAGKFFTMVYAIFGIPLVLSILDDLGKLLTKCLKYPWFLFKCLCRRLFRYCTKQTIEEIRKLDEEDRRDLEIFDLPIPVAIFIVISWIFVCSATFCIWEDSWDYYLAFYFFFISLSTIGLGDITPTQPKYLLMLFGYIIIGLSLVSMCINLIQAKLEHTYEAGREDLLIGTELSALERGGGGGGGGPSLGVLRRNSSFSLSSKDSPARRVLRRRRSHKGSQTLLSFPSPSRSPRPSLCISVDQSRAGRVLPASLSLDDVMRLVDTEEGDMLVLTALSRDVSVERDLPSSCDELGSASSAAPPPHAPPPAVVVSPTGSYDNPTQMVMTQLLKPSAHPTLNDIEELEEQEDRALLQPSTSAVAPPPRPAASHSQSAPSSLHFRSRLSLIPEHRSADERGGLLDEETEASTSGYGEINGSRAAPSTSSSSSESSAAGRRLAGVFRLISSHRRKSSQSAV